MPATTCSYGAVVVWMRPIARSALSLNQAVGDGLLNIIFNRADMSTYDQLVKDWRSQGDQIRSEFEQALQAAR
jgi:hypothetical protein